jgi:hypothetical protein
MREVQFQRAFFGRYLSATSPLAWNQLALWKFRLYLDSECQCAVRPPSWGPFFYAWKAPAGLVQCLISSRSARPSSEAILLTFGGESLVAASPPPERRSLTPVPDDHSPEPHAVMTDAETEMPLPSDPRTFFLGGLFALGFLAALYVASSIILPVVLAFVLSVLLVMGALVGLVAALSVPVATWAERLPEGIPRLEAHLQVIKGPIQALQKVIQQAEQVADAPPSRGSIVSVRRDLGLTGALFAGTRSVLDGLFTTVLVLYFLLVAGNIFLRRIVEILPTFSNKRRAVDISQQIQEDIRLW